MTMAKVAIGCQGGGSHTAFRSALRRFWDENATLHRGEELWNWLCVAAASAPVELRISPYDRSARWATRLLEWWAPRASWVNLRKLLEHHVRFDDVARVGALERLHELAEDWLLADDAAALKLRSAPVELPDLKRESVREVLSGVAAIQRLTRFRDELLTEEELAALRRIAGGSGELTRAEVTELLATTGRIRLRVPTMLVGAADVRSGDFKAFSSRGREIDAHAILASAAIPWLFQAVKDRYWDGLFSQNPPIRPFVAEPESREEKPDELWIVQINPQACASVPDSAYEIVERRNQLSGNLSLNQEISAIKATNRWISEGLIDDPRHKPVTLHWIRMNVETLKREGWPMGPASKLDRRARFLEALRTHGEVQARLFLPVRRFVESVWKKGVDDSGLCASSADALVEQIRSRFDELQDVHVTVDGMDLTPARRPDASVRGHADLEWSAHGLHKDTQRLVVLHGSARLDVVDGRIAGGTLLDVHLDRIRGAPGSAERRSSPPATPPPPRVVR
jgi:predicted acylesterase/phospholipase RssA